jgi:hypothetical protein
MRGADDERVRRTRQHRDRPPGGRPPTVPTTRRRETPKKRPSRSKVALTASLAVLGVAADLIGVLAAPSRLTLSVSIALFAAGLIMIPARRRLTWIGSSRTVTSTGVALMTVGVILSGLAFGFYWSARESAGSLATKQTCTAAEDFLETWESENSVYNSNISIVMGTMEQNITAATESSLSSLTNVADASGWLYGQELVHDVRADFDTSLAMEGTVQYVEQGMALQSRGWNAFQALSSACRASGHPVANYGYAIQPSIRTACIGYARSLAFASSHATGKQASEQMLASLAVLSEAVENGMLSNNSWFASESYQFANAFGYALYGNPNSAELSKYVSAATAIQRYCMNHELWPEPAPLRRLAAWLNGPGMAAFTAVLNTMTSVGKLAEADNVTYASLDAACERLARKITVAQTASPIPIQSAEKLYAAFLDQLSQSMADCNAGLKDRNQGLLAQMAARMAQSQADFNRMNASLEHAIGQ